MKIQSLIVMLSLAFILNHPLMAADGGSPLVQSEYAKAQTQLEGQMTAVQKTLKGLEEAKLKSIQASKTQAETDMEGIRELKRYYTLLLSRYSNDNGQFQPWRVLAHEDFDNINKLFDTYLQTKPLRGRVSAGQSDHTLDWGMGRLEEIYKMHKSPNADNSSDLEILSHQIKEAEASAKAVKAHADRLGLSLNEKAIEEAVNGGGNTEEREPSNQ
jgi:hypothetical protein